MNEIKKFLDAVDAHPEWGRIELTQPFIEEVRRLEKALYKACDMLRLFESGYAESEPAYALISSTLDGVECHDIKWWKEWCMRDD